MIGTKPWYQNGFTEYFKRLDHDTMGFSKIDPREAVKQSRDKKAASECSLSAFFIPKEVIARTVNRLFSIGFLR